LLVEAGHEVTGMTRSQAKVAALEKLGVEPIVCDAFDADALREAVTAARPEAVVHALTSLPRAIDPRRMGAQLEENDRLRRDGTRHLVDAALAAGAHRIVAESIAFAYAPGGPGWRVEDDTLDLSAPYPWGRTVGAVRDLEEAVTKTPGIDGVVLRFGAFYGPGTFYAPDGSTAELVRRRRFPIVGGGTGVTSFIHVDDAARATRLTLTRGAAGIYNVVDDDPATASEWLPVYAEAIGAKPPRRLPELAVRLLAGSAALAMLTGGEGASNAKAKHELGWAPVVPSWRQGFRAIVID
jgi:nucleoside-diphosphate-sugar epimerase